MPTHARQWSVLLLTVAFPGYAGADPVRVSAPVNALATGSSAVVLVEEFEAPFPTWETQWLGVNSNLENVYDHGGRGNNPDGLWLTDGDLNFHLDRDVRIRFTPALARSLTSLSIDIAGYVPATFYVLDAFDLTLFTAPVPLTEGAFTDPGRYRNFAISSSTGIGAFGFFLSGIDPIEGNTSIDNVTVTSAAPVPEPGSLALLGGGLAVLLGGSRLRQRRTEGSGGETVRRASHHPGGAREIA